MRFIADSMLGRLARWLRLLGYDTLYFVHIRDQLLLRIAKDENRILLTRDTRLVKVKGIGNYLLLKENDIFDQLKQVVFTYNLLQNADEGIYSRCSLCNSKLHPIEKKQALGKVPEYVYKTQEDFEYCPVCSKYYWQGTHREKLLKKISEILPAS